MADSITLQSGSNGAITLVGDSGGSLSLGAVEATILLKGTNQGPKGDTGADGPAGTTDYNALANKPTLGTAAATSSTDYATAAQGIKADTAVQPATLGSYATTAALSSGLSSKADTSHAHIIADTTGLQTALDGKQAAGSYASVSHTHSQADVSNLSSDLAAKVTANGAITGATKTKITYDAKGLVTSGADATTADIPDSTNKRYVTDANLVIINNTSGTNTGDNATNTTSNSYADSKVADTIIDGVTTVAPSQNAVYDALAGKQQLDSTLTALAAYNTNGILTQTAADTFAGRTITGTTNQITVTDGDGVSGNPTLSLPQDIHTGASPTFAGGTYTGTLTTTNINATGYLYLNTGPFRLLGASKNAEWGANAGGIYVDSYTAAANLVFKTQGVARLTVDASADIFTTANIYPTTDSTYTLGKPANYWSNTYTDRLYLNSTAYLDGASAGRMAATGQFYATDSKTSGAGDHASHSLATSASGTFTGNLFSLIIRPATSVNIGWLVGTKYNPVTTNAASITQMKAFYAVPEHASTGTITEMIGAEIQPYITTATGAITTVRVLKLSQWGGGAGNGTIGTFYGLFIENPQKTVTGNSYGINIGSIPCSGTAYSLITNNGNIVFNEGGDANSDVRIEGDTDQNLLFTDASADMVGIGTNAPTSKLDINSDNVRIRTAKTPASATATGTQGQVCWDTSYIYVCTATNTWKRSALTTW